MLEAFIDPKIYEVYPEYQVALVRLAGIKGQTSNDFTEKLLVQAEQIGKELLSSTQLENIDEIATWRNAYLKFGVKQRVARSSYESLLRRCEKGLPRIDLITDLYNYISIKHRLPIGGEDFSKYSGKPKLMIADGDENFETVLEGKPHIEHPDKGEVIWADDLGVTCRRWNWRQCTRTHLNTQTKDALFIFDGLGSNVETILKSASSELIGHAQTLWTNLEFEQITYSIDGQKTHLL